MRCTVLLMALAAILARAVCVLGRPNFALPGPCSTNTWKPKFTVPEDLRAGGLPKTLELLVTSPSCPADASLPFGSPAPVLFFYNGFMVSRDQGSRGHRRCRRCRQCSLHRAGCPPVRHLLAHLLVQNKASWYQRIVQQIASWGWAVVQVRW